MEKKPTEYSSNGDAYKAAALVAAAGITGCGATVSLSDNVIPGARPEQASVPGFSLPTPFGADLVRDGYWRVNPDFELPTPGIFYFTNGNDIVVVGQSPAIGNPALAESTAQARMQRGALYAAKYGVGGEKNPSGDMLITVDDYCRAPAAGGRISVYARGSIPLSHLPEARHADFLRQANLETRVGVPEARADTAEPSASVEITVDSVEANTTASVGVATVPLENERFEGTLMIGIPLAIAAVAGTFAWYTHRKRKKMQQNK